MCILSHCPQFSVCQASAQVAVSADSVHSAVAGPLVPDVEPYPVPHKCDQTVHGERSPQAVTHNNKGLKGCAE